MNILELKGVSFTYPSGTEALKEVSFTVEEGSAVALLGSNGAGKSTLLDLLLGIHANGAITLCGRPLASYGRKEVGRLIALVPQSEQFNFSFSLLDYTLFGRSPYLSQMQSPTALDAQIAWEALAEVGLAGFEERSITSLSGGEHQLLLLARAIAQQSRILLLDEPTSALDPANRKRTLSLLQRLHNRGKTLFFSTHDVNFAAELATHVVMLKGGRLLAAGPKEEVVNTAMLTTLYGTEMRTKTIDGQTFMY
ncbi:MAG: ABC transporter ATP-binding protein [Sphaerochaeta sp.]|jgi:iron complex transport system ATP-binding protein|nr:ABC transporter ATP-binding protein [Sphaerochaeta sp.]MDX9915796.1 ABC transporter ATP-binding protein [Sphaerochaeta sp.]